MKEALGVGNLIRNVALVGQQGNGKTSLVEAMLYRAGVLGRPGSVADGSTVGDTEPEERERHQSLSLTAVSFHWAGHDMTILDTPGYADFLAEALQAMQVAELTVFVIDAVSGVQTQDLVLWRYAAKDTRPRMIFINGLDRAHASFDATLASVRAAFGSHTEPVELPIGQGSSFHGITDLLTDDAFVYDSGRAVAVTVPEALEDAERTGHAHLVEEVVEGDDDILEQYLDGHAPTTEQLEQLLHDAVDAGKVFPVLCGSATTPIGVDHLLDFICHVGPAPTELGPVTVYAGEVPVEVAVDPDGDSLAYVFKTRIDQFLGTVSYLKVISGTIRAEDVLVNTRTRGSERLRQLLSFQGADQRHTHQIIAGAIAAVAKLVDTRTGDTLAVEGSPVVVPSPEVPAAVYGIAVRAATPANEDRLASGLARLVTEDPSLTVTFEQSTHQTVLSGGGETHLRVALARLARLGIELETEDVKVAYLETLKGSVEISARHRKQSGGHGQFAVATVAFEPLDRGAGFEFESRVTGGAIPRNLIPAVGAGIEAALVDAGVHGFPVVDVRAVCLDGQHHPVDSSEMAFRLAGAKALRSAVGQVGTEVLEPVSELTVQVPASLQGDVLGDLSSRRARVLGTGPIGGVGFAEVRALVPTAEIGNYAIDLRSMTGGAGQFTRSHDGYQVLPQSLVARVV
ncbi:MAG: elongation factor G [Acidimicrobiales bacterium]|nr:elongation factor G [Acidimicrobiales bacterium]